MTEIKKTGSSMSDTTRRTLLALLCAVSLSLAFESVCERGATASAYRQLDDTYENVVERLRTADDTRRAATEFIETALLEKAHGLARQFARDPGMLSDAAQVEQARRGINVDEVIVSDSDGIVVAAVPSSIIGYDMKSKAQSAAFMPAVTNSAFALVQKPMPRGFNGETFQYVGVARRDKRGIVQVGMSLSRLQETYSIVGAEGVARSFRVKRGGFVRIEPASSPNSCGHEHCCECEARLKHLLVRTGISGKWRISVGIPEVCGPLSHAVTFAVLSAVAVLLFLFLLHELAPLPFKTTHAQRRTILLALCAAATLAAGFATRLSRQDAQETRERLLMALEAVTTRVTLFQDVSGVQDVVTSSETADGFVDIATDDGSQYARGYFAIRRNGRGYLCLSALCGKRRVTVGVVEAARPLANPVATRVFFSLAALLFLCVLAALAPAIVVPLKASVKALGAFCWGLRARHHSNGSDRRALSALSQTLKSPVVIACAVAFLAATGVAWLVQTADTERRAREDLCEQVSAAVGDLGASVDNMLIAFARAIVRHYRRSDRVSHKAAEELVRRYDIDEVTVVNSNGIVTATNYGDSNLIMASSPESAKFNRLLNGVETYVQPFRGSIENPDVVRKYAGVPFPDAPGYVQIGIDRKRLATDLRNLFTDQVQKAATASGGFFLWTNATTGEIVANGSSEAMRGDTLASVGFNAATAPDAGVPFDAEFYGHRSMVVWRPYAGNMRLYGILPYAHVSALRNLLGACAILLAIFAAFAFFATRLTSLVAQLKTYIAAEGERQRADMVMANTIQRSSLPVSFPDTRSFRIFAQMTPTREVGGDFYDFYPMRDGRELFLVADTSGKGIPAAMFMMKAKAMLRAAIAEMPDLASAVALANSRLCDENEAQMFVTAWVGVLEPSTGRVVYVNAGHNPPLVRRGDGSVEWVKGRRGLVLAAMPGVKYVAQELVLAHDESILLYTDGVTEAMNGAHELYGESRLEAAFAKAGGKFVTEIRADVDAFAAGAQQADDITMLALDYFGPGESPTA